jgi:hypothetical protein
MIQDELNVGNVKTAAGDVSSNQNPHVVRFEAVECSNSLFLPKESMQTNIFEADRVEGNR